MRLRSFAKSLIAAACGLTAACSRAPRLVEDASVPLHAAALLQAACQPTFLIDSKPTPAGSAFLLRDPLYGGGTLLVSAHHLFQMADQHSSGMPWSEAPRRVRSATCRSLDHQFLAQAGPAIAVVGARALWHRPDVMDIALLHVAGAAREPKPLALAAAPPAFGDYVWLVAATSNPFAGYFHRAQVVNSQGFLKYIFDDSNIQMAQTSGAPVVNAAGQVVGVNIGGAYGPEHKWRIGVADNLGTIELALLSARSSR